MGEQERKGTCIYRGFNYNIWFYIYSYLFMNLFCIWKHSFTASTILHAMMTQLQSAAAAAAKSSVVSDSVRPHRRQPTRLHRPRDSPGKNTGVGCHFLLQCIKVKSESEVVQSCLTQRPHGLQPTRLLHPWDFPGKSTGVGCHCLTST